MVSVGPYLFANVLTCCVGDGGGGGGGDGDGEGKGESEGENKRMVRVMVDV